MRRRERSGKSERVIMGRYVRSLLAEWIRKLILDRAHAGSLYFLLSRWGDVRIWLGRWCVLVSAWVEGGRADSLVAKGTIRLWQTTPKSYGLWRYNGALPNGNGNGNGNGYIGEGYS